MRKILIVVLLLAAFLLNGEIIKIEKNSGRESVEYSSQDPSRIEISFNLLEYELEKITAESSVYSNYKIPGESELLLEGKPNLPVVTRLFVIPDAGDIEVAVNLVTETSDIVDPVYPAQPLSTESSRQTKPFTKDEAIYNSDSEFPDHVVVVGEPVICRDLRLIPVTFYPFQYIGAQNELKINTTINVTITINNSRGRNEKISSRKPSRAFEKLYSSVITNYKQEDNRNIEYQQPSYLFIHPDDDQIEGLLQNLIEWKHQKGYAVTAVSTAETGSDQLAIKDYIQNAYDNWEIPPEYVCLVGDANGAFSIPAGHYVEIPYDGENDHVYSLLEGNDILSDVIVGRLSFNSLLEFMTILSKILNYEKTPFLGDNEWFNRAIMVGDPSSSGPSCIDTSAIVEMIRNSHHMTE